MQPNNDLNIEADKLSKAIYSAYKEMVEEKVRLGREIVTSDINGNICIEPAIDYYKRMY